MASWLTGLANKAEDMLNSVDKAAATSLSSAAGGSPSQDPYSQWKPKTTVSTSNSYLNQTSKPLKSKMKETSLHAANSTGAVMTSSVSVPSNLNKMTTDPMSTSGAMSTSMYSQSSKKRDSDEELFEFLNSPDVKDNGNGSGKKKDKPSESGPTTVTNGHSRQSSTSSLSSQRSAKTPEAPAVINFTNVSELQANPSDSPDQSVNNSGDEGRLSPNMPTMNHTDSETQQSKSSLELENQLLKNEISSLNHEMTSVIARARESQDELTRVRRKLDSQSTNLSKHDSIIRELRAREADLTEALGAKDSQLAVLRVRFEEGEKELSQVKQAMDNLKEEKHRILNDHTSVSGAQNQALDGLKKKKVPTATLR